MRLKNSYILFFIVFFLWFLVRVLWLWPDQNLRIIVCDVGQGDAILIQRGFYQVIVDGGPGDRVLECLGGFIPFWDKNIEGIILSHPQADHLSGFISVLKRYNVESIVYTGIPNKSDVYQEFLELISQESTANLTKVDSRISYLVNDLSFQYLWPDKISHIERTVDTLSKSYDYNSDSIVFRLVYGKFSVLFTGDIGVDEELALTSSQLLLESTALKVPHHGSKTSSSTGFLKSVSPEVALISVGVNNRFNHPSPEVLDRLGLSIPVIKRTDEEGTLILVSDGLKYWFE